MKRRMTAALSPTSVLSDVLCLGDMTMKCERCGSDTRMQVQAVISAPGELAHRFSKQNLRRKDVYLMGVLWETADFVCTNPECGKVSAGYGNYVTNLKREVERLRRDIAILEDNTLP